MLLQAVRRRRVITPPYAAQCSGPAALVGQLAGGERASVAEADGASQHLAGQIPRPPHACRDAASLAAAPLHRCPALLACPRTCVLC